MLEVADGVEYSTGDLVRAAGESGGGESGGTGNVVLVDGNGCQVVARVVTNWSLQHEGQE